MVLRIPTESGRWSAVFLPAIIPLVILVCHGRSANENTYPGAGLASIQYVSNAPRVTQPSGTSIHPYSPPQHRFPRAGEQVASPKVILSLYHLQDTTGRILPCEFAVYGDPGLRDLIISSGRVQPGAENTSWEVTSALKAGHTYWWRARMTNGSQAGRWSTAQMFMIVAEPVATAPTAQFTLSPQTGCAPLAVGFINESSGGISSYKWNFGDGYGSSVVNPTHQYVGAGVYSVRLTVTGPSGQDAAVMYDCISVETKPTASFTVSATRGVRPLSVEFANHSTDATEWRWDFGDGEKSAEYEPVHRYMEPGTYTVTLAATGACGSDVMIAEDLILVDPCQVPSVDFGAEPVIGVAPLVVDFTQQTNGATSWSWDFGDGESAAEENPRHTYAEPGTYTVTLAAGNDCGCDQKANINLITVTETPVERMHIGAINASTKTWKLFLLAEADVRIVDDSGAPVEEATVLGHWPDRRANTCIFTTGADGWGTVRSEWGQGDADVSFCVDEIRKQGWMHDRAADETKCSTPGSVLQRSSVISNDDIAAIGATLDRPLAMNYPNPFNSATEINVFIPEPARVTIEIYNSVGRRVKQLLESFLSAGIHAITWDGTGDDAHSLASGVYFCRIVLDGSKGINRKMVLMK